MKGWRLITETPRIEVTSNAPRWDPNWSFTDQAGHEHNYASRGVSFAVVVDDSEWCHDCHEVHTVEHFECVECDEVISPVMTGPSNTREFIAGPTEAWLEGPQGEIIGLSGEQIKSIWGVDEDVLNRVLMAIIEEAT